MVPTDEAGLRAFIAAHEVCFEITQHFELHHQQKEAVGFDLALMARPPSGCAGAGCASCHLVYEGLVAVARAALPAGARVVFEPFHAAFHLRPQSDFRPEIEMVTSVLHRHGTFDALDEPERSYARQAARTLGRLGAGSGSWRVTTAA